MPTYKAIATITWKFESSESLTECLEKAKAQLDQILNTDPQGDAFEGFGVQMDIARMKDRKRLIHIAEFDTDDVLPHITESDDKREYVVDGESYMVRMNSERYFVFQDNNCCVACGIEGTKMVLDINPGDQSPHFNLYAEESGRLVLMTKDHILPKSRGGQDSLDNYQTMCCICNNLKGHYDLSLEDISGLRDLYNNEQKLPRKELREIINTTREEMALRNSKEE